ncbi:MAG: C10 family peptidase [Bacteroidales bacterium]|nr:C10 family peptidase [Bacteroidales bacterium]
MRGPIVLAHSTDGTYKDALLNESVAAWFSTIVGEIEYRRNDTSHYKEIDNEVLEKESSSLEFWKLITGDEKTLKTFSIKTKFPIEEPIEYEGYWKSVYQSQSTVEDGFIQHLMQTKWHQGAPFNYYCPYKTNVENQKAPAGCVAIAGAQMLYYLHYKLGTPLTAPTDAVCIGNVNNYSMNVSGGSSSVWDSMITDNYNVSRYYDDSYWDWSSALIAQVGIQVHMSYGNSGSGANTGDLVSNVFAASGINCQRISFNANKLLNSLKNEMPVIVSAHPMFEDGHAFIVDGYRSTKKNYYCDYQWMKYLGNGEYEPEERYLHEVTHSTPTLEEIYMNWGWGGSYDDVAFSPSGVWYAGGYYFSSDKKMIYNYSVSQ